mgnify:CR=1 FL=1
MEGRIKIKFTFTLFLQGQYLILRFSPKNIIVPSDDKVMRDEKMKKKAEEKAAKESKEDVYDEVFDLDHDDEYYGHLHDDAYMSADASEKVKL